MVNKRISILFLFPGFDYLHPITGGDRYSGAMIRAVLEDRRFATRIAPPLQKLPRFMAHHVLLRRMWYQLASVVAVLTTPYEVLVGDVSAHSWTLLALALARLLRPQTRIVVMSYHVRYLTSRRVGLRLAFERTSERAFLRLAHYVVTISADSHDKLRVMGLKEKQIAVIKPALDFPMPREEGLPVRNQGQGQPDNLKLLFVGKCTERKGLEFLLQALARLKELPLQLELAGAYDPANVYFRKLQGIVQQSGLAERVHFSGRVTDEERENHYRQADIFVFPSLDEGYGIALLEAMSYGLPVIASRVGALPELVNDHETGLLVPPAEPESLARAISELALSPTEREVFGRQGRQRALQLARSWDQVSADLLEFFAKLAPEQTR